MVEPNKKLYNLIKCVRPNDCLISKAVDIRGVSKTIFYEYAANTLSTTNQEDKNDLSNMEEFEILSKEYVETICINDILQSMHKVPTILSIDIEGKDIDVLKDINFDKYKPLLIVAELAGYKFRTDMHSKIKDFLESEGYVLLEYWDNEINGIFIVKERYKELTEKLHI